MKNTRKPQILIQTDGIQNTKVFVDGKELTGVAGIKFSQNYKENKGLPVLQIDLKATNVTLDAKMLPALPEPYNGQYISVSNIMHLVDDMPALSVMLTIIQAAMLPWEHGIKYENILNLFDKYVEEGGSQVDLYKDVVIPTLAVSGFFTQKMATEILEATDEDL